MTRGDPRDWMWSEALHMLAQAERLHQQAFKPQTTGRLRPSWEPPVDVLETEREVLILAALPGVDVQRVEAVIENGTLILSGERSVPAELRTAKIHRMELPQGRFERRIALPPGVYGEVRRFEANGCLVVTLAKAGSRRQP